MNKNLFSCNCEARCGSELYVKDGTIYFTQDGMKEPVKVTSIVKGFINDEYSYHPKYDRVLDTFFNRQSPDIFARYPDLDVPYVKG